MLTLNKKCGRRVPPTWYAPVCLLWHKYIILFPQIKKRQRWYVQTMWAYELELWPWTSLWLSITCILVLCQSTKCEFWWYYDYLFSIYGPLGQHGSNWSRDRATLNFDLGGHGACGWCGSSSSICTPSLRFIGLTIWKIWCTMCVSINGPGDPDLWLVCESHLRWGTFLPNLDMLGLWVLELFATYATDRRTDRQKQCILPHPYRGGGIINHICSLNRTGSHIVLLTY